MLVFAFASSESGAQWEWTGKGSCKRSSFSCRGHCRVTTSCGCRTARMCSVTRIASIYWGPNRGYKIPDPNSSLPITLIDSGAVNLIHGHSAHHFKAIEVYRNNVLIYGCGDFIEDEGIRGREEFPEGLVSTYVTRVRLADGALASLSLV